jgi:GDP-D-mannose dehydratase
LLGAEVHGYALDPQEHERLFDQLNLSERLASDTRADLADKDALMKAIEQAQPDVVLHLAAQPLVQLSSAVIRYTLGNIRYQCDGHCELVGCSAFGKNFLRGCMCHH